MTGSQHLDWGLIVSHLDDPASSPQDVSEHLASCEECRERLELARKTIERLPEALAPGAPDTWLERARKRAVPRSYLEPFRGDHVASVVFDSASQSIAGVRAGAAGDRQWLLAAGRFEFELQLSDPLERAPFALSGQIYVAQGAAAAVGDCRVRLEVGEQTRAEGRTEPSGEFLFRERPDGPFRVVVEGDDWTVATTLREP